MECYHFNHKEKKMSLFNMFVANKQRSKEKKIQETKDVAYCVGSFKNDIYVCFNYRALYPPSGKSRHYEITANLPKQSSLS